MINKNITIHITSKNINRIIEALKEYNIPHDINEYYKDINKFNDEIEAFGLPPYNGYKRRYNTYVVYIPIRFKSFVINLLGLDDNKNNFFHYDIPYKQQKNYNFTGKQIPKYPLYVVSFGRYNYCHYTVSNLELMNLKYWICIQEREKDGYMNMIKKNNFVNCLGLVLSQNTTEGSYRQRNKCIEHAIESNYTKCWILDDNIRGWYYRNEEINHKITNGFAFKVLENFMENIAEPIMIMCHNYLYDIRSNQFIKPFTVNHKNYSSLLLDLKLMNKYKIRFRLKYNEDVDLTLQALQNKLYTVGLNYILADKSPTKSCKGGNTDSIYKGDKFLDKFMGLYNAWANTPFEQFIHKIVKHKDKRQHHYVQYNNIAKLVGLNSNITPIKRYTKMKTFNNFGIKTS
jgi:hypothetical protein